MDIFINGVGVISPQESNSGFPDNFKNYSAEYLKCIEPNYKDFINPIQLRRMSRILKMGTAAAKLCLTDSVVEMPDAIITGTAMGCIEDTEKFLSTMIENKETLLTPTSFIQSTHNTVSAQVALMLKCNSYNYTYVNRGFSFESCLLDAKLMINDNEANNILVGGFDEITNNHFSITKKIGWWKEPINSFELLSSKTTGSIAGEGTAFFMLSNCRTEKSYARFAGIKTFFMPSDKNEIKENINEFLTENELSLSDIDTVIYGLNGDIQSDKVYYSINDELFNHSNSLYFKHLCGEYHTASSFAFWIASEILKYQHIPEILFVDAKQKSEPKNVLIYNHFQNRNHSFILLRK